MKTIGIAAFACVLGLLIGLGYMHNQNQDRVAAIAEVVAPVAVKAEEPRQPPPVEVEPEPVPEEPEPVDLIPVLVGDTLETVYDYLGEPRLEFPKNGTQVMWYAGYEIILTNGIVARIKDRPIETEEERRERARYAEAVDRRIRAGYSAMGQQGEREHAAWLERERLARIEKRAERKRLKDYEDRKSKEKRAAERSGSTIYVEHGY